MENEQNGTIKGGSVYITVDKFFNPVHISMKGTGEEGFQEFMQEDVEKALQRKKAGSGHQAPSLLLSRMKNIQEML